MTISKVDLHIGSGITAFSTTRGECRPEEPYSGFNTCYYTGDSPHRIAACQNILASQLDIDASRLILPLQRHTDRIAIIDRLPYPSELLDGIDAIVTRLPRVALGIHTADCVPLLMADNISGVIAAVHSGWKGTVARIAANTIDAMVQLGAAPSRITAVMGPCICRHCFEVGEEVAHKFIQAGFPESIIDRNHTKPHIDLPEAIAHTLMQCGVPRHNISLSCGCSRCHPDTYFSARRLGINSGRTLSVILLEESRV